MTMSIHEKGNTPFDLKLVLVKLVGLGFCLPTFSFCFRKSFFFSAFLRALEPILRVWNQV